MASSRAQEEDEDEPSDIAKQIKEAFGDISLYEILGIDASCVDQEAIKRAYRKSALKYHPDKGGSPNQFRALSLAYSILSDPGKKELYDKTGDVDAGSEELSGDFNVWYDFYRNLFPKITEEDIEKFSTEYVGSSEERKDVIEAYQRAKGDVEQIMERIMFAEEGQEERICGLIDEIIETGELAVLPKYERSKEKLLKKAAKAKTQNSKGKVKGKRKSEVDDSLVQAIQSRRSASSDAAASFAAILSKYGGDDISDEDDNIPNRFLSSASSSSSKKKPKSKEAKSVKAGKSVYDMSEEEFLNVQRGLGLGKPSK